MTTTRKLRGRMLIVCALLLLACPFVLGACPPPPEQVPPRSSGR